MNVNKTVNETELWKWLKKAHLQNDFGDDLHMERIENLVGVGNPDVTGCLRGGAFDIELKTVDRPARATTPLLPRDYVRAAQKNWLVARWRAGGQCYILLQVGKDKRYLIPGNMVRRLEGMDESELSPHSLVATDVTPWDLLMRASTARP